MRKYKKVTTRIIFIFIIAFIIITYAFIENMASENIEMEILQYLEEKYNEKFEIELTYQGYKSKEYWIDTTFECGHDKNIKEYVFKAKPINNKQIFSYITYWYDTESNEVEIKEVNGENSNSYDTSYEKYKKVYEAKVNIEENLRKSVPNNYKIDIYSEETIILTCDMNFQQTYRINKAKYDDLFNDLNNLVTNATYELYIDIKYNDAIINIDSTRGTIVEIDNEEMGLEEYFNICNIEDELKELVGLYYKGNYTIDVRSEYVTDIEINKNYMSSKNSFIELSKALLDYTQENSTNFVSLYFQDDYNLYVSYDKGIEIQKYNSEKQLIISIDNEI